MAGNLKLLERRLAKVESRLARGAGGAEDFGRYRDDPCGYCRNVLGVSLTPAQEEIARLILKPPHKVLVKAGHAVGKSMLAACLILWWHDCFKPGIVLSTAPTESQVRDIVWKEVRRLRGRRGGFPGPKIPRLETSADHFAQGYTARDGNSFQGHHSESVLIVFDEAVGVDPIFWEAAKTMLTGDRFAFLAIFNPTDSSSAAYREERSGGYHVVTMSCLDHPNIAAELAGLPAPYPASIRLSELRMLLGEWATPLRDDEDREPGDVRLGDVWYRPGPIAESRLLGRWPTRAFNSIWGEGLWEKVEATRHELVETWPIQIGCDVARFGDDSTVFHVRRGFCSLHHESHQGWSTSQTAARLRELCHRFAGRADPKAVPVLIDVGGVGGGVVDQANGYRFVGINSSMKSSREDRFPNIRSELWFASAEAAFEGLMDLSRLSEEVRQELRRQLLAPVYSVDHAGRMTVESKDRTKGRVGRSPDDADAFNLAWWVDGSHYGERVVGRVGQ